MTRGTFRLAKGRGPSPAELDPHLLSEAEPARDQEFASPGSGERSKIRIYMPDLLIVPGTGWLTIANGALGAGVLLCLGLVAGSVAYEFVVRARLRAHIIRNADAAVRALLNGRPDPK